MAEKNRNIIKPLVMKFGGTSVGSAEAILQTANIIINQYAQHTQLVVVASAMSGVTNLLLSSAQAAAAGNWKVYTRDISEIENRHLETIAALPLPDDKRQPLTAEIDAFIKQIGRAHV